MDLLRISLYTICIAGSLFSLNGMDLPKFQVIVNNALIGKYYSVPLKVTYYELPNKKISRIVSPEEVAYIGMSDIFLPGSTIAFSGYGQVVGHSIKDTGLFSHMFRSKWDAVKHSNTDPLVMTLSAKQSFTGPSELTFDFSNKLPEAITKKYDSIMASGNPLEAFGRLRYWRLENILQVDQLLNLPDDQIHKELVPASRIQNATTAEDVFRYMLGLDKNYTQDDIQRAYIELSVQWDPKNIIDDTHKKFAERVMALIEKAYTALMQALSPLDAFARYRDSELVAIMKTLDTDKLLEISDDQLATELIPTSTSAHALKAEDAFMYILGLNEDYKAPDVERAYAKLATQWDPKNIEGASNKKYAKRVLALIEKAHAILLQARKSKALTQ